MHDCEGGETEHLLYEAVGCCEHPVLVDKCSAADVGEAGFWTIGRPHLKQTHRRAGEESQCSSLCPFFAGLDVDELGCFRNDNIARVLSVGE